MKETHFDTSEDEVDKRQMREREATESSSSTFVLAESRPVGAPRDYRAEIKDESKMELDENDF
eukprot:4104371-Karenia_brevis.AAC.1